MKYDVVITIPNVEAKNEEEAIYRGREEAKIPDRGYVEVEKIEE